MAPPDPELDAEFGDQEEKVRNPCGFDCYRVMCPNFQFLRSSTWRRLERGRKRASFKSKSSKGKSSKEPPLSPSLTASTSR
jgi:hypothetical protein